MKKIAFNENWYFTRTWEERLASLTAAETETLEPVRIPHTVSMLPFSNFDQSVYQMVSGYIKFFDIPENMRGSRIFINFEGAAHQAEVFCNGALAGSHHCGYTAFRLELTDLIRFGETNLIAVKLDSREIDVPPFGGVIDYLTYGGLYREVWLEISGQEQISDIFIRGKADGTFRCTVKTDKEPGTKTTLRILDPAGETCFPETEITSEEISGCVAKVSPWSCDTPALYTAEARLYREGQEIDCIQTRFGFRTAEFRKNGFYLNGEKVLLRGLDRHQCWPYLGYAVPARAQRLDADILKNELGCNIVRTSHYPQSQHFIDRCDEIGLLVFTEIPGWQHIGGKEWIAQAIENVREMVTQYRNHPSIILWGVRINESRDNDEFYRESNKAAHELDDSRPTGGVRNFRKSHFFEDVYTYNDFLHNGTNAGCEPKSAVTSDPERPYLVTEYCGHMFPTKPFDDEAHRIRHALRHARVINDIAAQPDIAGSIGWCMFDYNTHPEFGSGDGVCWHGVLDMFRNPKLAAAVYASQSDSRPILEFGSTMDVGDWPAFAMTEVPAFSNADELRLYRNGNFVKSFRPSADYAALKHPPFLIDDFIGELLETREHYDARTAADLKKVIFAFVRYAEEPYSAEVLAAKKRLNDSGIADQTISMLQNQYMTYFGERTVVWRLDGIKDQKVVISRTFTPAKELHLDVNVDCTELYEDGCWDMATVRIAVKDENGNTQPYCCRALKLETSGEIELIGPDCIPLAGGMTGCYVRTKGSSGAGSLVIRADGIPTCQIDFIIKVHEKTEVQF